MSLETNRDCGDVFIGIYLSPNPRTSVLAWEGTLFPYSPLV